MKFELFDITDKLINKNTVFDIINIKDIDLLLKATKFNLSILYLSDNHYLMSYRIWIDRYTDEINTYPKPANKGHQWYSWWYPYPNNNSTEKNDNKTNYGSSTINSKFKVNFIGLSIFIFKNNDFYLLYDQVSELIEYNSFEDGRLYIDSNNKIKLIGNCLFNQDIKNLVNIKNNNIERGIISIDFGDINNIFNNIKINKKININKITVIFPEHHKLNIEKNWVHFISSDNKDYITLFNLPFGNPINNLLYLEKENKQKNYNFINYDKNILVDVPFFIELNKYYNDSFRFSAGSTLIYLNNKENIGIGHIVIDIQKIKEKHSDTYINELTINNNFNKVQSIIVNNNYKNCIHRPDYSKSYYMYDLHYENKIYLMFYYTQSRNFPFEILRIGNPFTPSISNYNTGIVFPCGISICNQDLFVSYGESDNRCLIFKVKVQDVDNMLLDIDKLHPAEYIIQSFDLFDSDRIKKRNNS